MQFIDLKAQYERIKQKIDDRINTVLQHHRYVMGPEIDELEKKLADYVGTAFCISCSSGTDALLMPLMAWGIGPGDAVFTTPFTFIATAEVIRLVGATPVFVDIDPHTFNIDPEALYDKIKSVIAEKRLTPGAVIPVDLFGLPADYQKIGPVTEEFNLPLLEDAAQGFGGTIGGRRAGSFGTAAATSFFPAKPLGCYGDGGAVFTDDPQLHSKIVSIRVHGEGSDRYSNDRIGLNARMDSIQAAILLEKMEIFPDELERRQKIADSYKQHLQGKVITPDCPDNFNSSWAQYSILFENTQKREINRNNLARHGVPAAIYYPLALHLQKAFEDLQYGQGDFPVAEDISSRILSLPMHPYLKESDLVKICALID